MPTHRLLCVVVAGLLVVAARPPTLPSPPTLVYPRVTGDALAARHAAAVASVGGPGDGHGAAPALRDVVAAGGQSTPSLGALPHGAWADLPDSAGGGRLWRLGLASSGGAATPSLSVLLTGASLPPGALLTIFAPGSAAGGPAPGACSGEDADPGSYDRLRTACIGPLDDAALARRGRAVAAPALPGGAAVVEVWVPPGSPAAAPPPTLTIDFVAPALDGDAVASGCATPPGAGAPPHLRRRRLAEEGGGGGGKAGATPPPLPGTLAAGGLAPADVFLPPDDVGGLLSSPVDGAGGDASAVGVPVVPASDRAAGTGALPAKGKTGHDGPPSRAGTDTATSGAPTLHTSYVFAPFQMRYDAYTSSCTPAASCYAGPGGGPSPYAGSGGGPAGAGLISDGTAVRLANVSRAAVSIYAVDRSLKTFSLCSGALVRLGGGPSGAGRRAPLLLTADHCLGNRTSLDNFDLWTLVFNYNTPCQPVPGQPGYTSPSYPAEPPPPPAPDAGQLVQGVRLLFYDASSDVTLLDIPGGVPSAYHAYFIGYDAAALGGLLAGGGAGAAAAADGAPPLPAQAVALHFPNGTPQRASFTGAANMSTSFDPPAGAWPAGQRLPTNRTHVEVRYALGTTERGSSGAPLIDLATGAVVAVLTGGFSTCANASAPDYYGRLSAAWAAGLGSLLGFIGDEGQAAVATALSADLTGLNAVTTGMGASLGTFSSGSGAAAAAGALLAAGSSAGEDGGASGPALGFSPSMVMWNASARATSENVDVFLVAPPTSPADTIQVSAYVWPLAWAEGAADPRDAVGVVPPRFTLSDPSQSVEVALVPTKGTPAASGLVSSSSGGSGGDGAGLARFYLWLEASSTLDPTWHDEVGVKVVVSTDPAATYATWLPRNASEGTVTPPLLVRAPDVRSPSGRAAFRYVPLPGEPTLWDVQVCLRPGLLGDAAVAVYRDGALAALTSDSPPYNAQRPGCVDIYSLPTVPGSAYDLVVSDSDFLNTVLPVDAVTVIAWLPLVLDAPPPGSPPGLAALASVGRAGLPTDWGRGGIFGGAGDLPAGGLAVNEFPSVIRLDGGVGEGRTTAQVAAFLAGVPAAGQTATVAVAIAPVPGEDAAGVGDLVVTPAQLAWTAANASAPALLTVAWRDGRAPRPAGNATPPVPPPPVRFDLTLTLTSTASAGTPRASDTVRGFAGASRAGGPPSPPPDVWPVPLTLSAPAANLTSGVAAVGLRLPARAYVDLTACLADSAAYPTVALAIFSEAGQLLRTYPGGTAVASTPAGCIFVEAENLGAGVATVAVVDASLAAALLPAAVLASFEATPASARRGRRPPRGTAAGRGGGVAVGST